MENEKLQEAIIELKAEVAELRKLVYDLMEKNNENEQGIYLDAVPEAYRDYIVSEMEKNRKKE